MCTFKNDLCMLNFQSVDISRFSVMDLCYNFYFRFTISDLETEGQYLFDMTLKVCFEVEGPCYVTVSVFNKYRLPKPACDWNTDFSIKGNYQMLIVFVLLKILRK